MSYRSKHQPPAWATLVLGCGLALPPLAHLAHREWRLSHPAGAASTPERFAALERELAVCRKQLALREEDLAVLSQWKRQKPEYAPRLARVLPIEDPSPRRHALWIDCGGEESAGPSAGVPAGVPAGAQPAGKETGGLAARREMPVVKDGALVGVVDLVAPGRSIARVQTLRDPYFRVRFRCREVWGFLCGTGVCRDGGPPLLEIEFLGSEVKFQEGEKVFTDGKDGIYPEGVLIGELIATVSGTSKGAFQVKAALTPNELHEVVLLVDRAASEARAASSESKP